jgi:hypothetical protein
MRVLVSRVPDQQRRRGSRGGRYWGGRHPRERTRRSKAKTGSKVDLTPLLGSLLPQEQLNNLLLCSGAESAAEVRRLFEQLNQSTLIIIVLVARLARLREALQKRKNG